MSAASSRRQAYKGRNIFSADELRRKREDQALEIRRQKRDDAFTKRRNLALANAAADSDDDSDNEELLNSEAVKDGVDGVVQGPITPESLQGLVKDLYSDDTDLQLKAVTQFRQLLSKQRNPPIQQVIDCNVVGRFVELLQSPQSMLQFEAAWALTNIASGTSSETHVVIDAGAVPLFVQLLSHSVLDVREQAVWALGNIAGDSPACRDLVLNEGVLPPLLVILTETHKLSMTRNATWALSNLCRGKSPQPNWHQISPALGALTRLLYALDDEVLGDACWAISYLSDGNYEKIQAVIDSGVVRRLVDLLHHSSTSVQTPALRSIGNIVTGNDQQTQTVIASGALPALLSLLSSPKENIRKEACWTLSNITAGSPVQVQAVIDNNIMPVLVHLLSRGDPKTRKEACWAISNATASAVTEPQQVRYLVSQGCIRPLCEILGNSDPKIVQVALDALENILQVGEIDKNANNGVNLYAQYIEEAGGMHDIHALQNHENNDIYQKAFLIMDKYFPDEEEEEPVADGTVPQVVNGQFSYNPTFNPMQFQ